MLAMALLLPGGHLGGLGGDAREVSSSGEGVLVPPIVPDGSRWGLETGELAHLLHSSKSYTWQSNRSDETSTLLDKLPRGCA